jgi:adenylylsulfate kinase-like enzyme
VSAPKLLIVSGPIASGKSSVAGTLAADFRASGHITAVVDLDRVYMMLDGRSPMDNASIWREARRVAAALTDQFVLDGIELVIVEGTFWTRSEKNRWFSTGHLSQ